MKTISVAGDRVVLLVEGRDSNGAYTIMEATLPPGGGPPPHLHHREDETFQVMVGEIEFHLGDEVRHLRKGEFIFAPRGIPHHFRNTGNSDAVLLETSSPSGIERFFEAAGDPLPDRTFPPLPFGLDRIAHMKAIAPDFEIEFLGPSSEA